MRCYEAMRCEAMPLEHKSAIHAIICYNTTHIYAYNIWMHSDADFFLKNQLPPWPGIFSASPTLNAAVWWKCSIVQGRAWNCSWEFLPHFHPWRWNHQCFPSPADQVAPWFYRCLLILLATEQPTVRTFLLFWSILGIEIWTPTIFQTCSENHGLPVWFSLLRSWFSNSKPLFLLCRTKMDQTNPNNSFCIWFCISWHF